MALVTDEAPMKKSGFTDEQMVAVLRDACTGAGRHSREEAQIIAQTIYTWCRRSECSSGEPTSQV
jgi:hypothetical protein